MRIVLDLTGAAGDSIEGTLSWADTANDEPIAFSGWLALMRLLEGAPSRSDDAARPDSGPI
jgi:hypothetical protein